MTENWILKMLHNKTLMWSKMGLFVLTLGISLLSKGREMIGHENLNVCPKEHGWYHTTEHGYTYIYNVGYGHSYTWNVDSILSHITWRKTSLVCWYACLLINGKDFKYKWESTPPNFMPQLKRNKNNYR